MRRNNLGRANAKPKKDDAGVAAREFRFKKYFLE